MVFVNKLDVFDVSVQPSHITIPGWILHLQWHVAVIIQWNDKNIWSYVTHRCALPAVLDSVTNIYRCTVIMPVNCVGCNLLFMICANYHVPLYYCIIIIIITDRIITDQCRISIFVQPLQFKLLYMT